VDDIIYDWNVLGNADRAPKLRWPDIHDETLRDGLQSPSVHDPDIDQKMAIARLIAKLGVYSISIGLPGAGPRARADAKRLAELVRDEKLPLNLGAACRTHPNDIRPIVEISQETGMPVEVMAFLGSSPIRMVTENWEVERLLDLTRDAVRMGVQNGLPTSFVTEDTTRSSPKTLYRLFAAAVEEGADRLILCDTVGHSTPEGVRNLVRWTNDLLIGMGVRDRVRVDYHGHNDRALGLANTLAAIEAGCDRVHGTMLGIGERVGNAANDQLMINLKLYGVETPDLSPLAELVALVSDVGRWPIPWNYPVFGRDAFRTATGVHAAAVIKALNRGDTELADRVYSGVPAHWVGRTQEIDVGPMSGESNVRHWLKSRGLEPHDGLVRAIFDRAKSADDTLLDDEILSIVASWRSDDAACLPHT
jgi:2-isopropylmalate synthase